VSLCLGESSPRLGFCRDGGLANPEGGEKRMIETQRHKEENSLLY
jgi:hypothetical protein